MLRMKMFEIRDRATYIPVLAIKMAPSDASSIEEAGIDAYHLRHTGYGLEYPLVVLMTLNGPRASYDPYDWHEGRTMTEAHHYIRDNFDMMEYGAVVDVEHILGETDTLKKSQRLE